jgi:biopolymer transport protein ExbD
MLRTVAHILVGLYILAGAASAQEPARNAQAEVIGVTVWPHGRIFPQVTEISLGDLQPKLWALTQTRKGLDEPIFVRVDKTVTYGELMQVMGVIASAGYKHISLVREIEDKPQQPVRHPSSAQTPDATDAASCANAVRSRIKQYWNPPIGGQSSENTIIRLRIELSRDGMPSGAPAVLDPSYSPVQQAMADAAVRAALRGQPYSIPPQQYELCQNMILRFDPREK